MPASHRTVPAIAATLLAVCFALALAMNEADPDLWHRFALGKWLLVHGEFPARDPYSYMPTRDTWVDHEWGCAVLFLAVHRALGDAGLLLLKTALFFGAAWACLRLMRPAPRRVLGGPMLFLLVCVVALMPGFSTTLRCHGFTVLFFAWWLVWLEGMRRTGRVPWLRLGVTMVLWANLHGGFLAGPALLAAYAAGETWNRRPVRPYLLLLAMACLLTLVNPYGPANVVNAVRALAHDRTGMPEWAGFSPTTAVGFPGFVALLAVTLLVALVRPRAWSRDRTARLLTAAAVVVSLLHVRHSMLLAPIAAAFVYRPAVISLRALRRRLPEARRGFLRRATAALAATLVAASLAGGAWRAAREGLRIGVPNELYATRAVDFIVRNHLTGRLLVPFNWGSYALWVLWPANQISFDGRYDLIYPPETIARLRAWEFGEDGAAQLLADNPPDVILAMRGSPPEDLLSGNPAWHAVYEDEAAVVFVPQEVRRREWMPACEHPARVESR